jgi:hypothetical protein
MFFRHIFYLKFLRKNKQLVWNIYQIMGINLCIPFAVIFARRSLSLNVINLRKIVSRHCEQSEAIQLRHTLWIASGFAFAMTNMYFTLNLMTLVSRLRRVKSKAPALHLLECCKAGALFLTRRSEDATPSEKIYFTAINTL